MKHGFTWNTDGTLNHFIADELRAVIGNPNRPETIDQAVADYVAAADIDPKLIPAKA